MRRLEFWWVSELLTQVKTRVATASKNNIFSFNPQKSLKNANPTASIVGSLEEYTALASGGMFSASSGWSLRSRAGQAWPTPSAGWWDAAGRSCSRCTWPALWGCSASVSWISVGQITLSSLYFEHSKNVFDKIEFLTFSSKLMELKNGNISQYNNPFTFNNSSLYDNNA